MTSSTPHPHSRDFEHAERLGDDHVGTSVDTPLRPDAFLLDDQEKISRIEPLFKEIMEVLGLDLTDDSLSGTPRRVAKMYVQEIFRGLNPANHPVCKTFDNAYQYGEMLVEKNITLNSTWDHYAKRPQVQERLTRQVAEALKAILDTEDVAVIMDAKHLCVSSRGIEDEGSATVTADYHGVFKTESVRREFLEHIRS